MENKKGTVAKIISHYYENNEEIPKHIIDCLSFEDGVKKTVKDKDRVFSITESNYFNCMKNLPFEAYKDFFNINWVLDKDDYSNSFIETSIKYNKKNTIKQSINLIKKELKKTKYEKNLKIERNFFETTLNIGYLLSKKNYDQNLIKYTFKSSLEIFRNYLNQRLLELKNNTNDAITIDKLDWHKNYRKIKLFFSNFPEIETITKSLVSNKDCFDLCKEAFEQYGDSNNNPFFQNDIVLAAMREGNMQFLNLIIKTGKVSKNKFKDSFSTILTRHINYFTANFNTKDENIGIPDLNKIKDIDSFLKENNIKYEYSSNDIDVLIYSEGKNKQEFINDKVNNFEYKGFLNLEQYSYLHKYVKTLKEIENNEGKVTEADYFFNKYGYP